MVSYYPHTESIVKYSTSDSSLMWSDHHFYSVLSLSVVAMYKCPYERKAIMPCEIVAVWPYMQDYSDSITCVHIACDIQFYI